jgi:hypothetical protein
MATEGKPMLKFDDYAMQATARAVLKFNPPAKDMYPTPEALVSYMEGIARQILEGEGCTFCGTLGFYLTAFPTAGDPHSRTVVATVSPSILD